MDQLTAHLDRGWDLVSRGDFRGALVSAQKGLELDVDSPEAHNLMAYVKAAEGNSEEALEYYRNAIDLDDSFAEAMLNAAELLIHPLQDLPGALELVEDALEFLQDDEEVADALLLKADILMHGGDREAAARVVRALPDGPFENGGMDFRMGRALLDLGELDAAEPKIRGAADLDPDNPEAQYYLGLVCEARGNGHGATLAFLRAREIDLATPRAPWSLPVEQFEKRVQAAIGRVPEALRAALEGALVVVGDVPGAEVVAEGVDPRMPLLLDDLAGDPKSPRVGRVFVYQRNVERAANGLLAVEDELFRAITLELEALLDPPAEEDEPGARAGGRA